MPIPPSFKDMPLWQQSMQLAVEICQLCLQLPASNKLVVSSSLQEAAITIPTLLARGSKAGKPGFLKALAAARLTAAEVETLVIVMQNIYNDNPLVALHDKTIELQQALSAMTMRLSGNTSSVPQQRQNVSA